MKGKVGKAKSWRLGVGLNGHDKPVDQKFPSIGKVIKSEGKTAISRLDKKSRGKKKYAEGGEVEAGNARAIAAMGGADPQPRLIKIFGNSLNTLSEEERGNALTHMASDKKWNDDEIRDMATNPSGRLSMKNK